MTTTASATRLITLIMILQRQPNQKAADLAAELGVSIRSLHRYIAMIDEMGIPVYAERGPHGGFSLVRGFRMPPLIFTPEEAAAVCLGAGLVKEMWGDLYADAAVGAASKIENVLPDEQREEVAWAQRRIVSTGVHHPSLAPYAGTLERIRNALRRERRVRLRYHGATREQASERTVSPYTLAHCRGWWYMVGHCHLRDDVRTFRIDRIEELNVLEDHADIPADFDPLPYLKMEIAPANPVCGRLRFLPEHINLASIGRNIWLSETAQEDGSLIVEFSLPNLEWATSLVLSFGGAALVEAPAPLQRMAAEWANRISAQYPAALSTQAPNPPSQPG
jgi:predicted DNA-binding transcriptional regulator YafY